MGHITWLIATDNIRHGEIQIPDCFDTTETDSWTPTKQQTGRYDRIIIFMRLGTISLICFPTPRFYEIPWLYI